MCGIDTISIISNEVVDGVLLAGECIIRENSGIHKQTKEPYYKARINPNNWDGFIDSYQKFQRVMTEITDVMGMANYRITRVDFAIDSLRDDYYEMHKLNKCICLLLAISENLKNRYESVDPLTLDHLTTRVQNEYIECENYNKDIQSNHYSPVYNRLEFRSKALLKTNKSIPELIEAWCKRLDRALIYFKQLQIKCNYELRKIWMKENGTEVKTLSEYLRKYQDNIYTSSQIDDFYKLLNFDNPLAKSKNFKRYNQFEYFSDKDLSDYIKALKATLRGYIS